MDSLLLHRGAAAAWDLVSAANAFVERQAPWALAKANDTAALDATLAALARSLMRLAVLAAPFIPSAAHTLHDALGLGADGDAAQAWSLAVSPRFEGAKTRRIPPLFPKADRVAASS
jgi:methionyl-tRNA synthetase